MDQGTKEWLEFRHKRIGSSDAPVIMGASPWKTIDQLLVEKSKKAPPKSKTSEAMERGHLLEPVARAYYELHSAIDFVPTVLLDKELDFLMGSFDGHNEYLKIDLEIKCPNREDHRIAVNGSVPEKYFWQCQHLLMVSRSERLDYFSFDGTRGVVVHVYPDIEAIKHLREQEILFWKRLTQC